MVKIMIHKVQHVQVVFYNLLGLWIQHSCN